MTSLNLYATRFDQVMTLLESKSSLEHIIIDTPGQIESFTWSSAGQIMTSLLATSFPTHLTYIVDTARCSSPSTFMSNMLYALSMSFRSRLPLQVVLNKSDLADPDTLKAWMSDYDSFSSSLDSHSDTYYDSLTRSLAMGLDEFYTTLEPVGVSAAMGTGIDDYIAKSDDRRKEVRGEGEGERGVSKLNMAEITCYTTSPPPPTPPFSFRAVPVSNALPTTNPPLPHLRFALNRQYFEGYYLDVLARREEQSAKESAVKEKAREDSMRRLEEDIESGKGGGGGEAS